MQKGCVASLLFLKLFLVSLIFKLKQTASSRGESHRVIILLSTIYTSYRYFDCNKLSYYGDRPKGQSSADLSYLQGIININPFYLYFLSVLKFCITVLYKI